MKLTRRDAATALLAMGFTGGLALGLRDRSIPDGDLADDEAVRATLTAVAEVVYPSEVTGIEAFIDAFVAGRLDAEARDLRATVAELDRLSRAWHEAPVAELSLVERDRLLREVGADQASEDPHGSTAERVRYHVVNELLLALYASPTGGRLVGLENPPGHPGGIESYRRGRE